MPFSSPRSPVPPFRQPAGPIPTHLIHVGCLGVAPAWAIGCRRAVAIAVNSAAQAVEGLGRHVGAVATFLAPRHAWRVGLHDVCKLPPPYCCAEVMPRSSPTAQVSPTALDPIIPAAPTRCAHGLMVTLIDGRTGRIFTSSWYGPV